MQPELQHKTVLTDTQKTLQRFNFAHDPQRKSIPIFVRRHFDVRMISAKIDSIFYRYAPSGTDKSFGRGEQCKSHRQCCSRVTQVYARRALLVATIEG